RQDIGCNHPAAKTSGSQETNGNRGIQMAARDTADRVDHCQNDQTKCQGDADMSDTAAARVIDDDGPGACEHQTESAKYLGCDRPPHPSTSPQHWAARSVNRARLPDSSIRHQPCSSNPWTQRSMTR